MRSSSSRRDTKRGEETGQIIDGRAIGREIEAKLSERVAGLPKAPVLGILRPGVTEGTRIYLRQIAGAAKRIGAEVTEYDPEPDIDSVLRELEEVARSSSGILVGHPLPEGLDFHRIIEAIPPHRDVEGLHPANLGLIISGEPRVLPPTPAAVLELVSRAGADLKGAEVVIVNHSSILGRPLSVMMLRANATISVCHVFTGDLAAHTRKADVLVVGAGVPGLIGSDMVKTGAVVVDVGMNRVDGKVCGDVVTDDVLSVSSSVTPVPGGVGPVTVAMLMRNLVELASR